MIITRKITNKRENDFYRHLALLSFPQLPASSVIRLVSGWLGFKFGHKLRPNSADAEPWVPSTCELARLLPAKELLGRNPAFLFLLFSLPSAHSLIL